jgi:hypothetical protein
VWKKYIITYTWLHNLFQTPDSSNSVLVAYRYEAYCQFFQTPVLTDVTITTDTSLLSRRLTD